MNRRRLLGLLTVAPLATVLGTRVPDQAQVDAIAQARADGYNRGRMVEEARQEARQQSIALSPRTKERFLALVRDWERMGMV